LVAVCSHPPSNTSKRDSSRCDEADPPGSAFAVSGDVTTCTGRDQVVSHAFVSGNIDFDGDLIQLLDLLAGDLENLGEAKDCASQGVPLTQGALIGDLVR